MDDTTQTVYGAKKTYFFYQSDLFTHMTLPKRSLDTTLYEVPNVSFLDSHAHRWADLGNHGTALRPVFPIFSKRIRQETGFSAYDPYFVDIDSVKHYHHLKRPHIFLSTFLGGQGRSFLDTYFTKNLSKVWNLSLGFRRIDTEKQLGARSFRGDKNVVSNAFHVGANHVSLDSLFVFTLVWQRQIHNLYETGGIWVPQGALAAEYFKYRRSDVRLDQALGQDRRRRIHVMQRVQLFPEIHPYVSLHREKRENSYDDDFNPQTLDSLTYPVRKPGIHEIAQRFTLTSTTLETGFVGQLKGTSYRLYGWKRNFYLGETDSLVGHFGRQSEHLLGFNHHFVSREGVLSGRTDVSYLFGHHYRLWHQLLLSRAAMRLGYAKKPVPLLYRHYESHYKPWTRSFLPTEEAELSLSYNHSLRDYLTLRPETRLFGQRRMVYFARDTLPYQSDVRWLGQLQYGLRAKGGFFRQLLLLDAHLLRQHRLRDAKKLQRFPAWWLNVRLAYQDSWFQRYADVLIGFDLHWESSYYAPAYHPITQQFHLQDEFQVQGYVPVDFFFCFAMENFRGLFKITHVNQPRNFGYFVSPNYPGERRLFDFGVTWNFYN